MGLEHKLYITDGSFCSILAPFRLDLIYQWLAHSERVLSSNPCRDLL